MTTGTIYNLSQTTAIRIENQTPSAYRLAKKPDGTLVLQGAFRWSEGECGGLEWREIQTIELESYETNLNMVPLCLVEGKPVYKGDVLYRPAQGTQGFVADRIYYGGNGDVYLMYENGEASWLEGPEWTKPEGGQDMTWAPPKAKREGFVCIRRLRGDMTSPGDKALNVDIVRNGLIFPTYEAAQAWADTWEDVVCIAPLTWEEPGCREEAQ